MTKRRLSLPATLLALGAVLASLLVGAPRADASSTLLCQQFAGCTSAGYSNYNYSANYTKMWWRMYAGHNCTNYVAYRMVSRGMSATRPWSGSGDARNWGVVFASKTNQTPMVGSVAWWSTNHVAYVEQIIDANTIVISEDHYGGTFDWRRIVRAGGGWPTGFIHLNDEAIAPTTPPAVSGTPQVDAPLAATAGSWNRAAATYSFQWFANGKAIAGATLQSFTPSAQQVAQPLTVKVTASKPGYASASSVSAPSAPTAPGTMNVATVPTVSGIAKVGAVLTATGGSFSPAPTGTTISWLSDGVPIAGANQATLTLGADQLNHHVTAVVTGQRAGYNDGVASSAPTAAVGPENLSMTAEPGLAGDPHVGHPLSVTPGAVGPDGVTTTYRWLRNGTVIRGADAARYVPTADDLGATLGVRVAYTKPGYTSIVRTLTLPRTVRVYPSIYLTSTAHRKVTVRVRAVGITAVHGRVTLVNLHGVRRTLTLVDGKATFSPDWLYAGKRTLTVSYLGSALVDTRTITKTLTVQ